MVPDPTEPSSGASNCKPRVGGVSRRTALINMIAATAVMTSNVSKGRALQFVLELAAVHDDDRDVRARARVVIGEREQRHPALHGARRDAIGRVGAVGAGGVTVELDAQDDKRTPRAAIVPAVYTRA